MKKDKKMMALYHRVNVIMQKSDALDRFITLLEAEIQAKVMMESLKK